MAQVTIPVDLMVQGNIKMTGSIQPSIARSTLRQEDNVRQKIAPTDWRVWDAFATTLPGTPANDDLGLVGGTFGTGSPTIQTGDLKAAGSTVRYARVTVALPYHYEAGQSVTVRVHAGMLTTVADTAATVDIEAYRSDDEGGIGSDLCSTAAQSINSLTLADKDFILTATTLLPGDTLDIRLAVTVNDAATGTAVTGVIGGVELLIDVKG